MTDRLTANEVFGESEVAHNKFLKYVGDCTISNLADEVLNLTIDQVFHSDIYQANAAVYINFGTAPMTDANGNSIPVDGYYTMDADGNAYAYTANDGDVLIYNGDISFLDDSAESHKICAGDFFKISGEDKLFYTPTAADVKPKWKYLLRTKTDGGEYTYEEALQYKASTDMDKLLDNMTENVHSATLQELSDDKILNLDSTMLESTVQSKIDSVTLTLPDGVTEGKKLGELTTEQMLAYTSALMAVIENINNA